MNIVCIIQARTTSSRLPNKVLLKLPYGEDSTVLEQVIKRVQKSKKVNNIVVATTTNEDDDKIEELCKTIKINCYRGSEDNVLSRYYKAAKKFDADYIIRITSDCPCIDSEIIDELVEKHINEKNDYTSNSLIRTYPHGLDCEIFSYDALKDAYNNAKEKFEYEHVTPYIYRTNKDKYQIGQLKLLKRKGAEKIRITLDTNEDYILLCALFDELYLNNNYFGCSEIIDLFEEKKWLYLINNSIKQKKVCDNLEAEIDEALHLMKTQDLNRAEKYLKEKYYGETK